MPTPPRGDASAGRLEIDPDELVEVRDLDSSFDLGVFSAEPTAAPPVAPTNPAAPPDGPRAGDAAVPAPGRSTRTPRSVTTFPALVDRTPLPRTRPFPSIFDPEPESRPEPPQKAKRPDGARAREIWPPWVTGLLSFAGVVLMAMTVLWMLGRSQPASGTVTAGPLQASGGAAPAAARAPGQGVGAADDRGTTGGDTSGREHAVATAGGSVPQVHSRGATPSSAARGPVTAPGDSRSSTGGVPRDPSGGPAGWVSLDVPTGVDVRIDGALFAGARGGQVLLPAGTHRIDAMSAEAGFQTSRTVQVVAGEVTAVPLDIPNGALTVEAEPTAIVIVDGAAIGTTPVVQRTVPVGVRTVTVRDILLGERTYHVVVREGRNTTLRVDLRAR